MTALEQRGHAILRRLPPRARMVEVGVLRGALSDYLLRRAPGIELVMVDNWRTADRQPEAYRATRDDHALHADAARVAAHKADALRVSRRFNARTVVVHECSVTAARAFDDGAFDLVFLDADHSEEGVRADIEAWLPKVRTGGWIGGHDFGNNDPKFDFSGVERAVRAAFWDDFESDENYCWFRRVAP